MQFNQVDIEEAEGRILTHDIFMFNGIAKKGQIVARPLIEQLRSEGISEIYTAKPEASDILENDAAKILAANLCASHTLTTAPANGRIYVLSEANGLATVNEKLIHAVNEVDEALTIATCRPLEPVTKGQMISTIKVIPFAVSKNVVNRVASVLSDGSPPIGVAPFQQKSVGLILTKNSWTKKSLMQKGEAIIEDRLADLGSEIVSTVVTRHDAPSVANALRELAQRGLSPLLILGASGICDRQDVVPSALSQAGGTVEHVGMPVDPGNLLMLGFLNGTPIVGVPTCARSRGPNGFDLVLRRLIADIPTSSLDIAHMGVGGLLK